MKLGVISDVHSNAPALDAALAILEDERLDGLVVLGDLLSYGCRPLDVLTRLARAARAWPTQFIVGNHDQLYFEMQRGDDGYYAKMPAWIQESARWTKAQLGELRLADAFPWQTEHVVGDTLFAHANPFAHGDWTYLNSEDARRRASLALAGRAMATGVFGHTHRILDETNGGVRLLNPGSLGQPRDGAGRSTIGLWSDGDWVVVPVAYDVDAHCADVERSSLSGPTQAEILKFHRGAHS